jgi:hypothetical protein
MKINPLTTLLLMAVNTNIHTQNTYLSMRFLQLAKGLPNIAVAVTTQNIFTLYEDLAGRVARWGKFSPIGRLFSLCSFSKITEVAHFFATFFPRKKFRIDFDKKTGWATHWAIF